MATSSPDVSAEPEVQHHPAILAHPLETYSAPPGTDVDFLGTKTRHQFEATMRGDAPPPERELTPAYPGFNEEYFEWIDILEAVEEASDTFVMVELGAGYGRWLMRAASALRRRPSCEFHSAAVEPEPDHFRWLLQNYRDNGLNPKNHDLTWAAIGAQPGYVPFWIGEADGWYGQAIASSHAASPPDAAERRRLKARAILGRPPAWSAREKTVVWVPQVTLADVLAPYRRVDLIDLDVQGAEVDVLEPAMGLVTARVRRVHIGTHAHALEARLRDLFTLYGWTKINDYPCERSSRTPFGEIHFADGVQTWLNPLLAPRQAVRVPPSAPLRPAPGDDGWKSREGLRKRLDASRSQYRAAKQESASLKDRLRAVEARLEEQNQRGFLSRLGSLIRRR